MKVVFIDEVNNLHSGNQYFTLYKVYEAYQSNMMDNLYIVTNDKGHEVNVRKTRFMPLYQWRNKQIDEILKED